MTLRTNYNDGGATQTTSNVTALDMNAISAQVNSNTARVFNVKDAAYGATGNGTTDDTTAIQAAITAAQTAGGGIVFFPTGQYLVTPTSSPALSVTANNVRLSGADKFGSMLVKNGNGILLSMSGPSSDPTGATHVRYCGIDNLGFNGNGNTGFLLQLYYVDNCGFDHVYMVSNADTAIAGVEFWDSRFFELTIENSGGAANSTTPNVWLRNSAATSGFGYSTDCCNQVHFQGCRFETWNTGCIRIEQGTGGTSNANGIYLSDMKMESVNIEGGPALYVDNTTISVHVKNLYIWMAAFASGYSTAQNAISWNCSYSSLQGVLIGNGSTATVASGVSVSSGSIGSALRDIYGRYNTAPTTAHITYTTSGGGDFCVDNCVANTGTQFSGSATTFAGLKPLRLVSGAVSDSSFSYAPPDGSQAIDTADVVPYFRSGGSWHSVATPGATQTLTSTRVNPRVGSTASSATPSINTDIYDLYEITALAAAVTGITVTGTPVDGQKLLIRWKDNGTARAITHGSSFQSSGVATMLATTVAGKTHMEGYIYNAATSTWWCYAVDAAGA